MIEHMGKEIERPLLATKLFIPPLRGNIVTRPRLLELLDNGRSHPLILVTAPAGFGKTTLVSCWLKHRQKRAGWVSLDKTDNIPTNFIAYIVEALQQVSGGTCGTITPLLKSAEPPEVDILLSYLINDLACLKKPVILVLDDYHVIEDERIHQALDFIVENVPPTLQIIITSRQTPPITISRLRARHQLVEVTAVNLRFTHDEITQFFADVMQVPLSDEAAVALEERTEGWIAGLQLAALGLKEQADSEAFIHAFTGDNRFVADYLVDEVLAHQSAENERFLMQTSILNRFNASLCNAVLGIDIAQDILLQMEKTNLFLIPLDNRRKWYRYHHLFGEMLYGRLQNTTKPLAPLYQKAAAWHTANGMIEAAIDYALAGQDFEQAISMIMLAIPDISDSNNRYLMIKWIEQLPLKLVKKNRTLWVQCILTRFYYNDFNEALAYLQRLDYLPSQDNSTMKLSIDQAYAVTLLATIILHTQMAVEESRDLYQQALAYLPEAAHLIKGIAIGHTGTANYLLGDMVSAKANLAEGIRLIEGSASWSVIIMFKGYLAKVTARQGQLKQAARICRDLQDFVSELGFHESASLAFTLINWGLIHYEWNDLAQAEALIHAGERQARSSAAVDRLLQIAQALVKTSVTVEDVFDISKFLQRIERLAQKYDNPPLVISRLDALHAFLALKQGKLALSVQWTNDFIQKYKEIVVIQQFEWMTIARIWLASGNEKDSIHLIQSLQTLAQKDGRDRDYIEISVLLVKAYYQAGKETEAAQLLQSVLLMAEPEGYIRTFVDAGTVIEHLLGELVAKVSSPQSSTAYINQIRSAFPKTPATNRQPLIENLTPRETEVLQLLAEGLSYTQISETLTITNNTLKTHIKRIYSKLNVHNRVQAISAGQDAGILTD